MAKRNKIKNVNEKDNKIKAIINYLSFKDWVKTFGLIAAVFSIFGITKLDIDTIGKKSDSPMSPFSGASFGPSSAPPKPPTHKHFKFSFDLEITNDDKVAKDIEEAKMDAKVAMGKPPGSALQMKSNNVYISKDEKNEVESKITHASQSPVVAMMASPPPPEIVYESIVVKGISRPITSNNVSIVDVDAETLLSKIQTADGIVITSSSEETDEYLILINSHKQIKSLWDVYCYDSDFSNQCEIFNHD